MNFNFWSEFWKTPRSSNIRVYKTLWNIYDEAYWESSQRLKTVYCFRKTFHHKCLLGSLIRLWKYHLKLVSAIFYQTFIFHKMTAPQKLWKMFFISSKKLFSLSRYSNFCIFVFPLFYSVSHCFRVWSKKIIKVYDAINCLNMSLMTHFVWYLEKKIRYDIKTLPIDIELNKEHFCQKIMQKMCTKSSPQTPFKFS